MMQGVFFRVMMDYIDMEEGSDGFNYVLMGVDKFCRLAEFTPTVGTTAIAATRATMRWSSSSEATWA